MIDHVELERTLLFELVHRHLKSHHRLIVVALETAGHRKFIQVLLDDRLFVWLYLSRSTRKAHSSLCQTIDLDILEHGVASAIGVHTSE